MAEGEYKRKFRYFRVTDIRRYCSHPDRALTVTASSIKNARRKESVLRGGHISISLKHYMENIFRTDLTSLTVQATISAICLFV